MPALPRPDGPWRIHQLARLTLTPEEQTALLAAAAAGDDLARFHLRAVLAHERGRGNQEDSTPCATRLTRSRRPSPS
jgi:hypothetical protein